MIRIEIIYVDENHAYVNNSCVIPSMNNELFEEGFLYRVEGDYKPTRHFDKDGFQIFDSHVHFFKQKEAAEKYAAEQEQKNFYGKEIRVNKVEHQETLEEFNAKQRKIAEEKKAKKDARDRKKAEELGITLEEYREIQNLRKKVKKLDSDTKKHEDAIRDNNKQKKSALQRLNQLSAKCQSKGER